jgi:periplasmic protein CpxP/Spy
MTKPLFHLIEKRTMSTTAKNKLLIWLVILLLVANAATIAMFWLNKKQHPLQPKGSAKEFLIKELKLDTAQQAQLEVLVKEHRQAAEQIREKIKNAKESFFDLLKQANVTDSVKQAATRNVSSYTEELDLLTLNHFQKIRILCNAEQQKKFDEIIHDITRMMAQPPGRPGGPPPGGPGGDRPPPPGH